MRILEKLAIFALVLSSQIALATEPGDPARGLAYAKDVCSECHAVQAGQKVSPNIKAPPFELVARSKLVTQREILAWLQSSHTDMPDLSVPPDKRDDVTAYILSLGE